MATATASLTGPLRQRPTKATTPTGCATICASGIAAGSLGSGAMAQFWMSYEIPAPGLGSYMQWLAVGENGMLDFDRLEHVTT